MLQKPDDDARRTARVDRKASYRRMSLNLLPRDPDNIRAVTKALKQLHITHPRMVASVMSFLERRPPDEHTSSTASFKGEGGRELLEARAYKGRLHLHAPVPRHLMAKPDGDIEIVLEHPNPGVPLPRDITRRDMKKILMDVPDARDQLKELNEQVGIYHRVIAPDEVITLNGETLLSCPQDLEELKLLVKLPRRGPPRPRGKSKPTKLSPVRDKTVLVRNVRALIAALDEAVAYEPTDRRNHPPPDLWSDDKGYIGAIKQLAAELKRLNDVLLSRSPKRGARTQSVLNLKKHANTFLTSYADTMGKGTGYLTIALLATVVYQAGVNTDLVAKFYKILK